MPEINPDDVNAERSSLAVVQHNRQNQALMKANRFLLMLVFMLTVAVFVMGLILIPRQRNVLLENHQTAATIAYQTQNPAISAEIRTLKGQLFGLVSGSIDSKLRSLEESIKKGSLTESLNTVQDIRSNVNLLNTYNAESAAKADELTINQRLIQEMSDLKDLVYLTFISCGLMFAAVGAIWLRSRYRLTHHPKKQAYLSKED